MVGYLFCNCFSCVINEYVKTTATLVLEIKYYIHIYFIFLLAINSEDVLLEIETQF